MQLVAWIAVCVVVAVLTRNHPRIYLSAGVVAWFAIPVVGSRLVTGEVGGPLSFHPATWLIAACAGVQLLHNPRAVAAAVARQVHVFLVLALVAGAAVAATVDLFGGIDILVNNASAIWLRGTLETPMKRFDLMSQVNSRGSFLCAQACLPYLLQAPNPHILTLAHPPSMDPKWWAPHTGYTLAKMGMSFVTLGLAAEFGPRGVAVNALWPRTLIATEALNMIPGVDAVNGRKPEIMADAAHAVLTRAAEGFSGNFLIDDEVLAAVGVTDLSGYAVDPSQPLYPDLFLD